MIALDRIDHEIAALKDRRNRLTELRRVQDELRARLSMEATDTTDLILGVITDQAINEFPVSLVELMSRSRTVKVAEVRQLIMHLARKLSGGAIPLETVGRYFERDHGTVLHAERAVADRIDTDLGFAAKAERIEARIRAALPESVLTGAKAVWHYSI